MEAYGVEPVVVVTGTRPEIIKMAPIIRALQKAALPYMFVHCGQHYDYNMAQQFIENLELPAPSHWLKIESSSPGAQTAEIMMRMDELLSKNPCSIVLVEGDTNTVLSAALAANKRVVPIGHVEAGLRSFDLRMPEEHNRRLTDHISNYLFAPTQRAIANLEDEKVWGKVFLTGNTAIDAVNEHLPIAEKKSRIMEQVRFGEFVLATAHRAENVDDPAVLESFIGVFEESPLPIVYPMHPRTKRRLEENGKLSALMEMPNVLVLPPLGYLDFLMLEKMCRLIITDSGGIQEEATAPQIRKHVLVIRLSTERPEAAEAGFARVVGTDKNRILAAMNEALASETPLPSASPFGGGHAAQRTVEIIKENFV
ncbi:MAG: UDP-N-acetylglucosamine 2-epimerase (non-hydrolyzing) [Candidatus Bathyarchaeota archaeon]|nr:UDP-N-acetylglucosamine 2-epimerase (non-hydrolyzing) [Candidatus Bathyarchaeota archaeon]